MIIEDKLSPCQAGFVDSAVAPERSMPRETLLDFFADLSRTTGTFLVHDDGFRVRSWTYAEVRPPLRRLPGRWPRTESATTTRS